MRILFCLSLVSASVIAKISITPDKMVIFPNQCREVNVHFSEAIAGGVRRILLSANSPKVSVFASRDCSGGAETTISSDKKEFHFTVQPAPDIAKGPYTAIIKSICRDEPTCKEEIGAVSLMIKWGN